MHEYGSTRAVLAVRRAVAAIRRLAVPGHQALASVVAAALCVGLTWSPLLSRHTDPAGVFYVTPWVLWMYAGALLVAALVRGWLGLAVAYLAVRGLIAGTETATWTVVYFAVGVLLLHVLDKAPRPVLRWLLVGSALVSIGASLLSPWPWGSFQNYAAQGAMLAMVLPLAPLWALPILGIGLLWSHSYVAGFASLTGMLVAYPGQYRMILMVVVVVVAEYAVLGFKSLGSGQDRLQLWVSGLRDLAHSPLFGYGPSSWALRMNTPFKNEIWWAAHNEPLQWVYETGMAGAGLMVGWLSEAIRRVAVTSPQWRGAAAAVLVCSLGLQVFHYPTLAPVALLVLGGALQGAR